LDVSACFENDTSIERKSQKVEKEVGVTRQKISNC
jgi:hypothetical protein